MSDSLLDCDVVVVGAGLSGLTCAHLLCEAGLDTIVLEAANRIGGRIHSLREQSSGVQIADLGPTWVWPPYQPTIVRWLDRLGIETFSQFETGDMVYEFDADSPVQHHATPGQHGIRRIRGGPQALIDRLSEFLPKGMVKTDHAVTAVRIDGDTVVVTTSNSAKSVIRARRAVIATPLRMAYQSIIWPTGFEKKILLEMSETPTWMATQAKAVILYEKPFWRERGLSGRIASQVGPLVEVHDHSLPDGRQASLFGFIGLPHLARRSNPKELREQISHQLAKCFGDEAGSHTEIHIEDWALNSNICADLDLTSPPSHPETVSESLRTSNCGGHIYFSVAETALQSPGLIEGAFSAAENTTHDVIADLHNN